MKKPDKNVRLGSRRPDHLSRVVMLRMMFRMVLPGVMMFVSFDALGGGGRHEQR